MWDKMFSAEALEETVWILQNEFPLAVWETVYVTVIATAFAILLGLPLLQGQNKAGVIISILGTMVECIVLMAVYTVKIEGKYRR